MRYDALILSKDIFYLSFEMQNCNDFLLVYQLSKRLTNKQTNIFNRRLADAQWIIIIDSIKFNVNQFYANQNQTKPKPNQIHSIKLQQKYIASAHVRKNSHFFFFISKFIAFLFNTFSFSLQLITLVVHLFDVRF